MIREEKLQNRVAMVYFPKFDCDRIVGNDADNVIIPIDCGE